MTLRRGDCLAVMRTLPAESVDAVIVDPPYGTTDLSWDQAPPLADWWEQINRVARPQAVVAVFASGKFVPELIASNLRHWRYDLIWEKNRPVGFLNCNSQPMRAHENILIFCRRFKDGVYNPQKTPGKPYISMHRRANRSQVYRGHRGVQTINTGDRHPRSVLRFDVPAGEERVEHSTQKPLALIEWLVSSYSNPGDVVLDSYMGSGTTGVACENLGRRFIGIEKSVKYFNLARRRIAEAAATGSPRRMAA